MPNATKTEEEIAAVICKAVSDLWSAWAALRAKTSMNTAHGLHPEFLETALAEAENILDVFDAIQKGQCDDVDIVAFFGAVLAAQNKLTVAGNTKRAVQ